MTDPENGRPALPGRREFIALGIGAFVVASLPGSLRPRRRLFRRAVPVMGTIAEVAVVGRDARWARGGLDAAVTELRRVERGMSRFRADSDVGRANAGAAGGPVAVSAATLAVVEEALRWAAASGGAFDPALGRAVELWDVGRRREPPPADAARRWAGRELWRAVEVAEWGGRPALVFHDPDVALDLGGIAKGYAVDRAVAALRDWGVTGGLVNAGGDLYALGTSLEDDPWRVGIRAPDGSGRIAGTLEVADRAVATSGDYERYFEHGGRRYHHLLDPRTGAPRRARIHGVTVLADACMTADAAGTAAFGLDLAAARRRIARVAPGAEVVHA